MNVSRSTGCRRCPNPCGVHHYEGCRIRGLSDRRHRSQRREWSTRFPGSRRGPLNVRSDLETIEQRLSTLPSLEETLARFQEAGLEERLRERSILVREETVLKSIPKRLQPLRRCLEGLRQEIPIDRAFVSAKAIKDLPGKDILAGADAVFEHLNRDIDELVSRFEQALEVADQGITRIRTRWSERQREVQTEYEKILSEAMDALDKVTKSIRELVEDLLEGGKEAFETRRLKYGF